MLIVRHQDQTGNETEKGTENVNVIGTEKGIGKWVRRGLQAEISVSLGTGGRDIPLKHMTGTGLYHITLGVPVLVLEVLQYVTLYVNTLMGMMSFVGAFVLLSTGLLQCFGGIYWLHLQGDWVWFKWKLK